MSPYLLKSLTPVRYLVSLLHSLPSLRFSHALQAGMRYFYIPSEMSCAHKICFDTNTSVSLCCFFHTVTPLHSHNMDTLLLPWPFLSPSTVLFILPPPLPFFNSIVTSPVFPSCTKAFSFIRYHFIPNDSFPEFIFPLSNASLPHKNHFRHCCFLLGNHLKAGLGIKKRSWKLLA